MHDLEFATRHGNYLVLVDQLQINPVQLMDGSSAIVVAEDVYRHITLGIEPDYDVMDPLVVGPWLLFEWMIKGLTPIVVEGCRPAHGANR
jgi:hypothetical protein